MADDATVLDFPRANFARFNERFDRIEARLDELVTRTATVERDLAAKMDFAGMHGRLDTFDRRLSRIERRLDLVEISPA